MIRVIEEVVLSSLANVYLRSGNQTSVFSKKPLSNDIDPVFFEIISSRKPSNSSVPLSSHTEGISVLIDIWFSCCRLYLGLKDFDNALVCLREALQFDPVSAKLCYHFGLYYEQQKHIEKAILWYHRALAIHPHHTETHIRLGMLHIEQAKAKEQQEQQQQRQLQGTLRGQIIYPSEADTSTNHTSSQIRPLYGSESLVAWAAAEMHLQTASRHDPQNATTWYGLGVLLKHRYQTHQLAGASPSDDAILARSVECLTHALHLEKIRPVRPFYACDAHRPSFRH
jgi:tetratricopeptide (TPR) repeat protein